MSQRTEWDAGQYNRYADERSRPFFDLTARIRTNQPASVIDLGCGPGNLTATLADRWPDAAVIGVDNDANMLAAAAKEQRPNLRFEAGDLATWEPSSPVDVVVANAALQWTHGHLALLHRYVGWLRPGGALALQVPGNFDDPHHLSIREVLARPRWQAALAHMPERPMSSYPATVYLSTLADLGCDTDCWETTYVHVLQGERPVLEWIKGTALRPVLSRLTSNDADDFAHEVDELLATSFGTRSWGTPFPFRRVFAVGHRS
jgi:trans-aconitate 2-methyltransferase